MPTSLKLGALTLVREFHGAHVQVTVLGDGALGQRALCGKFTTNVAEFESLQTLIPIIDLAEEIGRHWRDQEGVNGALLDQLAKLTGPPKPDDGYDDEYDKATWGRATGG
jgi:hypothetical protein